MDHAAPGGSAVEIAHAVQSQRRARVLTVRIAFGRDEGIENRLMTGRIHFEHGSFSGGSARLGGPIEVVSGVANHAGVGICAVGRSGERVQNGFFASGIELIHDARVGSASIVSSAPKIARSVGIDPADWVCSVSAAPERVQHGFFAGRIHSIDNAQTRGSAGVGGSVEIPVAVTDDPGRGIGAGLERGRERMQHGFERLSVGGPYSGDGP